MLRHHLRQKLAPIAPPLRTSRVEPGAALSELERAPREANLLAPLELRAFPPAVALASIAAPTHQNLAVALEPGAVEHPKRLVDHGRNARQFLDKGREPSDTAGAVRATTRRMKARSTSPGFRLFGGVRVVTELSSPGPDPARSSGFQPRFAPA